MQWIGTQDVIEHLAIHECKSLIIVPSIYWNGKIH